LKISINFISKRFFKYNKSLFVLYDYDNIKFFTKNKFENKITIKESLIKDIKICQKNEENKIVVFIPKKIFFIQIIEHYNEYMILEQKDINEYNNLIFNSKLDLWNLLEAVIKILYIFSYSQNIAIINFTNLLIQNIINFIS